MRMYLDVQDENGEEAVGATNLEDFVINNGVLVEYNGTASEDYNSTELRR